MLMKPFACTLEPGTSVANKTGSWRTKRPVYVKRLPPCNNACPAGENVQEWLSLVQTGDYEAAWRSLVQNNPMPAVMGRVCYHTCENACNRKDLDAAVSINAVEQFLGDEARRKGWIFDKSAAASGKRVLVVGSGPAGLSAAYHLARLGHKVTMHESLPKAGGMLRYGIPRYRLPREVLDAEIQRILDLGIEMKTGSKIDDILKAKKDGKYDAVFAAVGAQVGKLTDIPVTGKAQILDAVTVLREMGGDTPPKLGKRVAVYGGGNTAIDVARTAKRLGASEVTIVYRRNREKMPAHDFEVEEALQEGIKIKFLSTIKKADGQTLTLEAMALDDKGMPQPTGKFETMKADCAVLALGQAADLALVAKAPGVDIAREMVQVDDSLRTGCEGLFAGGDAVTMDRTATRAVGHGKRAARAIDAWLRGISDARAKPALATVDRLNIWYYVKSARTERGMMSAKTRAKSFDEVRAGLLADAAMAEARRCLSCGNCFACDNCYAMCPDNAVRKLGEGKGYAIDLDYCKGCGLCASECPCGAIEMVQEDI